jgi:hypothetical protein
VKILSNGREIFQRREKKSEAARIGEETHFGRPKQGSETKLTSGDRRYAEDEEAHKICETDERRTGGLARRSGGRKGRGD